MTRLTDHFPARPDGRAMLPEAEYEQLDAILPFNRENVREIWGPRLVGMAIGLAISLPVIVFALWQTVRA